MPHVLKKWLDRIKAIEREYRITQLATDRLRADVKRDPTILGHNRKLRVRDVRDASAHLEGIYIIRLFAEFETGLRLFWPTERGTVPPSRTRDLLDGVAATQDIP